MNTTSILFPHLGIQLLHVGRIVSVFGFKIAYYGIVVSLGMCLGISLVGYLAKKSEQDPDEYVNLCMVIMLFSIIGARIYYVVFCWDYYRLHLAEVLDIRGGGLGIYGGILTGVLVIWIHTKRKKHSFWLSMDTIMPGVLVGQILGRWGNFFNREAFGQYTDGLFAMALPQEAVFQSDITEEMLEHVYEIDGIAMIQVHPTFLYEATWNLVLLGILAHMWKRKKFDGQICFLYFIGYGIGRFLIESLRTDQLLIPGTEIPISMVVAVVLVVISIVLWKQKSKNKI